jgi:hypothetical protein
MMVEIGREERKSDGGWMIELWLDPCCINSIQFIPVGGGTIFYILAIVGFSSIISVYLVACLVGYIV